jgi:uroporphyrinogen decarboxylase
MKPQQIFDIVQRKNTAGPGFWMGIPYDNKAVERCAKAWEIPASREEMAHYLGDCIRPLPCEHFYNDPSGLKALDAYRGVKKTSHTSPGCLANATCIADVEKYEWPNVKYLDFSPAYNQFKANPDKVFLSGMWSSFFTSLSSFLGMENYFCMMYTDPDIVQAITEHVVRYYAEANEKFCAGLPDDVHNVMLFFGVDLGTQRDLFIAPEKFETFILPQFKRLFAVGKKDNIPNVLHSCGSIYRIIPQLIDAGVDVLHPLQAKAAGMSADELAQYKNEIAFLGGIDTQELLEKATPDEVRRECERVWNVLGRNLILSPSHEALLPTFPPENVRAIAETVQKLNDW